MILGVVAVVLIIFLIFRTVSLSSKLEEVQNQLTQSQDYKQKYEDMQLENMQLQRLTICRSQSLSQQWLLIRVKTIVKLIC